MGKIWAIKMLLVWRWRLGYWDWDAFKSALAKNCERYEKCNTN